MRRCSIPIPVPSMPKICLLQRHGSKHNDVPSDCLRSQPEKWENMGLQSLWGGNSGNFLFGPFFEDNTGTIKTKGMKLHRLFKVKWRYRKWVSPSPKKTWVLLHPGFILRVFLLFISSLSEGRTHPKGSKRKLYLRAKQRISFLQTN